MIFVESYKTMMLCGEEIGQELPIHLS